LKSPEQMLIQRSGRVATLMLLRIAGFVIGAGGALALELALLLLVDGLSGRQFLPRGPGWIVLPIVLGVALSRSAPEIWARAAGGNILVLSAFRRKSIALRLAVIVPLFWAIVVLTYVAVFQPFGEYMASADYATVAKVVIFPSVVFLVGLGIYRTFFAQRSG
jgi:hypothetical protein